MSRVTCPLGHTYESEQFSSCPICNPGQIGGNATIVYTPKGAGGQIGDNETTQQSRGAGSGDTQVFGPGGGATVDGDGEKTQAYTPDDNFGKTIRMGSSGNGGNARAGDGATGGQTIRIPQNVPNVANNIIPSVGWLVCIEGKEKGKDYRIVAGGNSIGRAGGQVTPDIVLQDEQVSRGVQAMLFYDPENDDYVLQSGQVHGLTKVNGVLLTGAVALNYHDKIKMGSSVFLFEPLCREGFSWRD